MDSNKYCISCKQYKDLSLFCYQKKTKDKKHPYCKECKRNYYLENKYRYRANLTRWRKRHIRHFRIQNSEYKWNDLGLKIDFGAKEQLLYEQDFKCAICNTELSRPALDHCHKTKAIRGILCMLCNTGIGSLKDSPIIMKAAIKYLR